MSEERNTGEDAKAKMLAALAKKQKGSNSGKSVGPQSCIDANLAQPN
jgi:hypothetical protein